VEETGGTPLHPQNDDFLYSHHLQWQTKENLGVAILEIKQILDR